jgi:diguanylate cyclase (GGDEF)-like protein
MRLLANLERQNKPPLVFIGFVLIGVIGLIDYATGAEFAFSVFYMLPISLVTWATDQRSGLLASITSAAIWFAADITTAHSYSSPFIPIWNSLIRLAFFVIITLLLSSLKRSLELSHTDFLTSAGNARFFYEIAQMEINRLERTRRPFTVAYIDLDNFKSVNDQFGHAAGDQVLIALVSAIRNMVRKTDLVARLGGDEFAILFPETDQESARVIFNKVQDSFLKVMRQKGWPVTFSVGLLTCLTTPDTSQELVRVADRLMYTAKADGKNTVKYAAYPDGSKR